MIRRHTIRVESWLGVRYNYLEDGDAERIGCAFKIGIRELWYALGRAD